ncbi:hypothetical protein D3C75_666160 [compost metagenome]
MRRWHHRDGFFGEINTQPHQLFVNCWEMMAYKLFWFVADIKVHAVCTQTLHLMIDGASDDISRSQFTTLIKIRHEP